MLNKISDFCFLCTCQSQHIQINIKIVFLDLVTGRDEFLAKEQRLVGALSEAGLAVGDEFEQGAALLDVLQDFCVGLVCAFSSGV